MKKKSLVKSDLIKVPRSRSKKDLFTFIFICCFTFSLIIGYSIIENDPLNSILREFDLEYFDSKNQSSFGIEGSKYITNDMKLKFTCNVPKNTKTVMIKLYNDPNWIQINTSKSFTLTAKYPSVLPSIYILSLRCDDQTCSFITTIYRPDLPVVKISNSYDINHLEKNCIVEVKPISYSVGQYSWANRELNAKIRMRNSGDGFKLELKNPKSLLSMREDDDWILLPSKDNASVLRAKLALDVYNLLGDENPLCKISNAEPVDLYLNDRYLGLYLLSEQVDRKLFDLKTELPENSMDCDMLFKCENGKRSGKRQWEQIYPKERNFGSYPLELNKFILNSIDTKFFDNQSGIFTKINREQLIDFIIFELFVSGNGLKEFKFYLIRNTNFEPKYYLAPWVFDASWGLSSNDELSIYSLSGIYTNWDPLFYKLFFSNKKSLSEQFIKDIKNRWLFLRNSAWSDEILTTTFLNLFNYMRSGLLRSKNENIDMIFNQILHWKSNQTKLLNEPSYIIYSELPSVYVTYDDEIVKSDYVDCTFNLYQSNPFYKSGLINSSIKYKGRSYWRTLGKKSYRLELSKKISLLGMRDDDDWYLFSLHFDFTRMRIKLAFDLWRSLLPTNPTAILPDSRYVNLFLNGEYRGIYLFSEKKDKKLFGLDDSQDNINSSFIFNCVGFTNLSHYLSSDWEQEWPNSDDEKIKDVILPELINFINSTSDDLFFDSVNGIYSKFDKLNLIDFFLYNFFIMHEDFWYTNYLIIRDTYTSKFYLCPWDFDGSFGQWGWLKFDISSTSTEWIISHNILYNRLLNNTEFIQDCKDRWKELREEIWSEEFILSLLIANYDEIKELLDFEMYHLWPPKTVETKADIRERWLESTKEFNLDEYVDDLFLCIPERLEVLDSFFDEI